MSVRYDLLLAHSMLYSIISASTSTFISSHQIAVSTDSSQAWG